MTYTILSIATSAEPSTIHALVAQLIPDEDYPEFTGNGNIFIPVREISSNGAAISANNPLFVFRSPIRPVGINISGSGKHTIATPAPGKAIAITSIDLTASEPTTIAFLDETADGQTSDPLLTLTGIQGYSKESPHPFLFSTDRLFRIELSAATTVTGSVQYLEV